MNKKIILLAGKISSGKNFVFDIMEHALGEENVKRSYFAEYLKTTSRDAFKDYNIHLNQSVHTILDIIEEEIPYGHQHDRATAILQQLLLEDHNWFEDKTDASRIFLQNFGTDVVRNRIDKDFWVKKAAESIKESDCPYFISTDLRFTDEYNALREALKDDIDTYSFYPIIVKRDSSTTESISEHESENSLNDFPKWYGSIDNNGTKEDTVSLVVSLIGGILNGEEEV